MTVVFFRPEMSVPTVSFSPSSDKAAKVVADWQTHASTKDHRPTIYSDFTYLPKEELYMVHNKEYVDAVVEGTECNGFGNKDPAVAQACLLNISSMLTAAECASSTPRITCSPTSGFHHAGYDFGNGFCTFNGLAFTAMTMVRRGVPKVLILDLDYHSGNGTRDIIDKFGLTKVVQYSSGESQVSSWSELQAFIRAAFDTNPRLVLYQAGADMHIDDPLGGLLTTKQMKDRDELVFDLAVRRGVGLVWNLAGGYQTAAGGSLGPLLTLHRNTYLASAKANSRMRAFA